jgi:hypothetical protein
MHIQALRELFGLDPEAPDYELPEEKGAPADVASLEDHRRKAT